MRSGALVSFLDPSSSAHPSLFRSALKCVRQMCGAAAIGKAVLFCYGLTRKALSIPVEAHRNHPGTKRGEREHSALPMCGMCALQVFLKRCRNKCERGVFVMADLSVKAWAALKPSALRRGKKTLCEGVSSKVEKIDAGNFWIFRRKTEKSIGRKRFQFRSTWVLFRRHRI